MFIVLRHFPVKIITLDSVDSTNLYIKSHPELWDEDFTTVHAHEQYAGRGRFTRTWYSGKDLDLTFTTLFTTTVPLSQLSCITMLTGLALSRVVRRLLPQSSLEELSIKWPNDVLFYGKKLAGILVESTPNVKNSDRTLVLIGMGVNVNREIFPIEVEESATSIKKITGKVTEISELLRSILIELKYMIKGFRGNLSDELLHEWISQSDSLGKRVLYEDEKGSHLGKIITPLANGMILLEDGKSGEEFTYSGELVYA